jgi:hypothetical protein
MLSRKLAACLAIVSATLPAAALAARGAKGTALPATALIARGSQGNALRAAARMTASEAGRTTPAALYSSRELWATVDACNPKDKPGTLGIRGSMPSDGQKGDTLFMRFRVQYEEVKSKQWVDVAKNADSGFQPVHRAGAASQAGIDFQVAVPATGGFTLRGVVSFQWRHGARVAYATTRATSAGHESFAGADPKGFSAATCTIA